MTKQAEKQNEISIDIMSQIAIWMKYAKYLPNEQRRENWTEIVDRNKNMHIKKFPQIREEIEEAYKFVYEKKVLPSMRALQFSGKAALLNNARLFNCSYVAMDHPDAFSELFFLLLSGCGVGYSVQRHHIKKLPEIVQPVKTKRYLVGDSLEGWADALKVLLKAHFYGKPRPIFDFRSIREKGAPLVTSGGKAPGPEPLADCLHNVQKILDRKKPGEKLTTLEVHDINCYVADAVMAGGIRRAAMISVFDFDDEDMLTCKFGDWYVVNPQRGRANNSAMILRHKIEKKEFMAFWEKIVASGTGEPGFIFSNDKEIAVNPCGEVALKNNQFCNLGNINAGTVVDQEDLNARAKAAAFICTLQASYTDFHYLREEWKEITDKDALIGVGLAGIASGKVLKLNLEEAAEIVKEENARVAKLIGINKASRTTVVKPDGHTSLVLGTSSGIHAWHSQYYIRRVRVGKGESIYTYLQINHPELLEDDYFTPKTQAIISVPQKAPDGALTRDERALDLLNRVGDVFERWIVPGHRRGANKNNTSCTVSVREDEWAEVGEWMWKNKERFTALSVLPHTEHNYKQPPFEEIDEKTYRKMIKSLHEINLDGVIEISDETKLKDTAACAAGGCEIP